MAKATALTELQALATQAAELEDQTQTKVSSDFEYTPPAAGMTVGRLVEYIELGVQPQRDFRGQKKKPAEQVRVAFELLHPDKNVREYDKEDGTKGKIADRITLTLLKSLSDKAKFKKLFEKMRYGRDEIKHMAQMLGEGFIITVVHNTVKGTEGKADRTYANITDKDGSFLVGAPFKEDAITGTKEAYKIPAALSEHRLFLFELPTKTTWDSLFIDGEKEVKDGEKTKMVSKNWIQNAILSAKNFEGSALQQLLEGINELPEIQEAIADDGSDLDGLELPGDDPEGETEEEPAEAPAPKAATKAAAKAPAKAAAAKKPVAAAQAAKTASATTATKSPSKASAKKAATPPADDPLAALGLI